MRKRTRSWSPIELRLLGRQFAFSDLGEQRLKGFASPMKVWRIDAERQSESRFEATRDGRLGPFVGREHEMGMLLQRWEEAKEGECQLALISGEAGIGKSRIVSEFMQRLEGDVRRIALQASPLHTNTALYPVVRRLSCGLAFGPTIARPRSGTSSSPRYPANRRGETSP